jgi:uncharacterized membrane protein
LGNWNWLRPWLARTYRIYKAEIVYPLLSAVCLGLFTFLLALFQKNLRRVFLNSIYLLPVAAGLIYWFFTAPDPRFAHALFLLLTFGAFLVCMSCLYEPTGNVWGTALNIGVFVIFMFYLFPINEINITASFPAYQPIPTSALAEKKTDSGLTVYVPVTGDQCWDSPLPCTPNFVPELRLRVPGKITSGFTQR